MEWRRGSLDLEQLDLILQYVPADLSFADEHDVLLYWKGETYKTCDARYIGRDVRDCHPVDTLDCLEDILRQFKAGTQDVAEGWEHKKNGRLMHTRYFAVRDHEGAYKGILEMNQDVTRIRGLEGDQAIPGWED